MTWALNWSSKLSTHVAEVVPRLLSGDVHMAAAGLSITDSRREYLSFGHPYNTVDMHLIYKLGSGRPRSIEATAGRSIEVVASSSHSEMMASLGEIYPDLEWSENADVEVVELLERGCRRRSRLHHSRQHRIQHSTTLLSGSASCTRPRRRRPPSPGHSRLSKATACWRRPTIT